MPKKALRQYPHQIKSIHWTGDSPFVDSLPDINFRFHRPIWNLQWFRFTTSQFKLILKYSQDCFSIRPTYVLGFYMHTNALESLILSTPVEVIHLIQLLVAG